MSAANTGIELVVLVLADGFRSDVLARLLRSGALPNISRYLLSEGSYLEGTTVLPSVSDVAYLPMLTGQYPGTANIPGVRWVDKSRFTAGKLLMAGHRSYISPSHVNFDKDLSPDLDTIFELSAGSVAARCDIRRGLPPDNNGFSHVLSMPFMFFSHYLKRAGFIDSIAMRSILSSMGRMNGDLPRFVFFPVLEVDLSSHGYGPLHRRTIAAYGHVDELIGTIVERLRRVGVLDKTCLLLVSDHGHTETKQHLDLTRLLSDLDYNVFEHPIVYRRRADAAVMVSGNSLGHLYFPLDGRWEAPLTEGELHGEHSPALEVIRRREEVEWIAYRRQEGEIKIASSCGEAVLGSENGSYTYAFDGRDPLRLGLPHSSVPRSQALTQTVETDFPDALEQLWYLFQSQRTGDVVVTAKSGYDLRGWREWPEHHSSHGALCSEHMRVPIVSSRPLSPDGPVRTVDIFPTLLDALGLEATKPHFGRSLWQSG